MFARCRSELVFFSKEVYMQDLPAITLQHPQLYIATIFKTVILIIATDFVNYKNYKNLCL